MVTELLTPIDTIETFIIRVKYNLKGVWFQILNSVLYDLLKKLLLSQISKGGVVSDLKGM